MPSYSQDHFAGLDLDDIMCKQLLSLDLRDADNQLSPIGRAKASPGFIGQQRGCDASLSLGALARLDAGPPDDGCLSSGMWGPQPEGRQAPGQWRKHDFLSQRSLSMVETGTAAESPGWSGSDVMMMLMMKGGQEGVGPAPSVSSSNSSASSRYKTELCRSFTESGTCKYGGKCQFAHGPDELRDLSRHPKYKTEPCRTFHTIGFCPYGIRCHFVHNNEEEIDHMSRSSSCFSSSSFALQSRANRIPLMRQSISFSGFPTPPQHSLPPPPPAAFFARGQSASPPCADITDLLAQVFSETEPTTLQASAAPQYQPASAADPRSPFLPSPDSGCSPSGPSPPPSPGAPPLFSRSLGTRSLSYASLSDQDQDGGSSASSLSGLESSNEGKRLAVFSQLSVPEDGAGSGL
ncbi:mRNA decay activator protein ZFP36-like [Entelurus aequoreus]|uniref:mRNA decay activator protein ZFP36-like n=1 Tax=Entelurus aequoreus TaxID=161455 RepID=UPI002B1DBFAD|nr:mRNA decay activator protein ZFP36-like [Entelurus aequoreus]